MNNEHILKIEIKSIFVVKDVEVIHSIVFAARNLTSNVGMFLLLENVKANGIFDLINTGLVFDYQSTDKIKMNHIKTMLYGHYIGIDRLERIKLLQGDPLDEALRILV